MEVLLGGPEIVIQNVYLMPSSKNVCLSFPCNGDSTSVTLDYEKKEGWMDDDRIKEFILLNSVVWW